MAAPYEIRTTFHGRRFPRPSWFRSKNSPSAADLALAEEFGLLDEIDNLRPSRSEPVREDPIPDDADIEGVRRLHPEEFRKRWNALENRVRVAEGMVDIRPDRLRTAGRPSVKESNERVDSGLSLPNDDLTDKDLVDEVFANKNITDNGIVDNQAQPNPRWKGKARETETETEAHDQQKPLAGLEEVMRRLVEIENKYNGRNAHDSGPTPSRRPLPTDDPLTAMTRDCAICTDELFVLDFPVRPASSKCNHPVRSCTGCLNSWLTSELADKGHETLTCPECSKELSYEDVRRATSRETFAVYDRASTNSVCIIVWNGIGTSRARSMTTESVGGKRMRRRRRLWRCWKMFLSHVLDLAASGDYRRSMGVISEYSEVIQECDFSERMLISSSMTCRRCKFEFCWQ
jgi:hypothetical protein